MMKRKEHGDDNRLQTLHERRHPHIKDNNLKTIKEVRVHNVEEETRIFAKIDH